MTLACGGRRCAHPQGGAIGASLDGVTYGPHGLTLALPDGGFHGLDEAAD